MLQTYSYNWKYYQLKIKVETEHQIHAFSTTGVCKPSNVYFHSSVLLSLKIWEMVAQKVNSVINREFFQAKGETTFKKKTEGSINRKQMPLVSWSSFTVLVRNFNFASETDGWNSSSTSNHFKTTFYSLIVSLINVAVIQKTPIQQYFPHHAHSRSLTWPFYIYIYSGKYHLPDWLNMKKLQPHFSAISEKNRMWKALLQSASEKNGSLCTCKILNICPKSKRSSYLQYPSQIHYRMIDIYLTNSVDQCLENYMSVMQVLAYGLPIIF